METKTELMRKWALMQKQMNDLEEIINSMPDEPKQVEKWQPKGGEWFVAGDGSVTKHSSHVNFKNFGVEYPTKEAAEKARDAMRVHNRLLAWLAENDDGWVADWDDKYLPKFYVYLDNHSNRWGVDRTINIKYLGTVYMSKDNADKLCKLLNDGVVEL